MFTTWIKLRAKISHQYFPCIYCKPNKTSHFKCLLLHTFVSISPLPAPMTKQLTEHSDVFPVWLSCLSKYEIAGSWLRLLYNSRNTGEASSKSELFIWPGSLPFFFSSPFSLSFCAHSWTWPNLFPEESCGCCCQTMPAIIFLQPHIQTGGRARGKEERKALLSESVKSSVETRLFRVVLSCRTDKKKTT